MLKIMAIETLYTLRISNELPVEGLPFRVIFRSSAIVIPPINSLVKIFRQWNKESTIVLVNNKFYLEQKTTQISEAINSDI